MSLSLSVCVLSVIMPSVAVGLNICPVSSHQGGGCGDEADGGGAGRHRGERRCGRPVVQLENVWFRAKVLIYLNKREQSTYNTAVTGGDSNQ